MRLVLARAMDKLETAQMRGIPSNTAFLSPVQRTAVEQLIQAMGNPRHIFDGGCQDPERSICVFLPDWLDEDSWPMEDSPLTALLLTAPEPAELSHRDWLGSILGLGLNREKIGDLLVSGHQCQAIVLSETAGIIISQMERVGRWPVKCSPMSLDDLVQPERKTKIIRDSLASLRLDVVAASAFSLSRGKATSLISSGNISLNHVVCSKPDRQISQSDVISCRGRGKCIVNAISGKTKKGRIKVELERYL